MSLPRTKSKRMLRVLIVEDLKDAADTLHILVSMWGHEGRVARDGFAALREAGIFKPHVILLDLGLPALSGYEVARMLRRMPGLQPGMLLIATTGYGEVADREASAGAGIDFHLLKPVDLDELQKMLAWAGSGSLERNAG